MKAAIRSAGRWPLGLLAATGVVLLVLPQVVSPAILSVLITIVYLAYLGQAWNVMMGFAGQLSLGHALYIGLGAYTAAALFTHFGIGPWIGMLVGMAVAAGAGAVIGFLGFRFGIRGIYFALLTIAFAEFTRVLFDHFGWVGGSSGLFLKVEYTDENDLWMLRGAPVMFYYVLLGMTAAALALCWALLRSRIGYYWRAIREDQEAAAAMGIPVFRYKMYAVMLSAALTAAAGTIYAFYFNTLYPELMFSIGSSIEILLGPIVGGLGTLGGPLIGAVVLGIAGELLSDLAELSGLNGLKQFAYGIFLVAVIIARPDGLWPWAKRLLRLEGGRDA